MAGEKTFFDDVKETADNNKTGLGAGVIGLMLAIFAFDIGIIPSLLVGLGAFALGNYFGDSEKGFVSGLFKKPDPNAASVDLEPLGITRQQTVSLTPAQVAHLNECGPEVSVVQNGQEVTIDYKGLSDKGVPVTMQSKGMLNGNQLVSEGVLSIGKYTVDVPANMQTVALLGDGKLDVDAIKKSFIDGNFADAQVAEFTRKTRQSPEVATTATDKDPDVVRAPLLPANPVKQAINNKTNSSNQPPR